MENFVYKFHRQFDNKSKVVYKNPENKNPIDIACLSI